MYTSVTAEAPAVGEAHSPLGTEATGGIFYFHLLALALPPRHWHTARQALC